jgi:hypothetical protein
MKTYRFNLKGEIHEYDLPEIVIAKIKDLEKRLKAVCRSHFEMCGELPEETNDNRSTGRSR